MDCISKYCETEELGGTNISVEEHTFENYRAYPKEVIFSVLNDNIPANFAKSMQRKLSSLLGTYFQTKKLLNASISTTYCTLYLLIHILTYLLTTVLTYLLT